MHIVSVSDWFGRLRHLVTVNKRVNINTRSVTGSKLWSPALKYQWHSMLVLDVNCDVQKQSSVGVILRDTSLWKEKYFFNTVSSTN